MLKTEQAIKFSTEKANAQTAHSFFSNAQKSQRSKK
jgi:hypothetical protein